MIVSDIGCGFTKQVCVGINCLYDAGQNQKELDIFLRGITRISQVHAVIGSQGPVVMLTGTIDTCERFLMKQAGKALTAGNLL